VESVAVSTQAGVLVDQVLQRVRSPEGITAPRSFVLKMLSASQNLVNAKLNLVLDTATLTTEPERVFYPIRALLPQAQKPLFVQEGPRDLVYAPWRSFWYMKRGWPRQLGERYELWSLIGRDVLVVWPARRVATPLVVTSTRLTVALANERDLMELPDDTLPMVVDLAEVLTLLRMRNLAPASEALESLIGRMKERST
jgi:hypothetical protein